MILLKWTASEQATTCDEISLKETLFVPPIKEQQITEALHILLYLLP